MKYSHRVFLIVLLLAAAFTLSPVAALKVEGAKIMLDVTPGTTYLFPMAVSIKPDDAASNYTIDILGFGQALDGGRYEGLSPDMDSLSILGHVFISSLPSPTVPLQPGERKEFNATIRVPGNVGAGGRYAVILIHPAGSRNRTGVSRHRRAGAGDAHDRGNQFDGDRGDHRGCGWRGHCRETHHRLNDPEEYRQSSLLWGHQPADWCEDSSGREAGSAKTDPFVRAVIPGQSVRFNTPLTAGLPAGTYTVVSRMTLEDGTLLDEESTTLTVTEEYIPPFEAATVKVVPDRETVLKTPGGEIGITFPAGAVLSDAEMTISPYSGSLPEPPSGSKAGTTAISVDGLTGILAKPATIVVKYNPADLQAAGGDAATLSLARWDRADVKWILLPTTVDAAAMTLTAATDRFGIMAIMGGGEQETGEGGGLLPGPHPAVLFGALAIGAVFYLKRRK